MHWDSNPLHCLESGIDCDSWVNGTFYNIHVIRSSNAILWLLISVSNWIFASTVICRMLQEETWFKNLAKVMIPMWELWSAWVRNPCAISDCFLQVMMVPRHCWGQHLRLPPKGGQKYWNWSPEILRFIAHILSTPNHPLLSNGVGNIEIYGKRNLSPFHYVPSFQWVQPNGVRIIEIHGKHPLPGLRHLAIN